MSLQPTASFQFDLLDGNRLVGWVRGGTIGFGGFADENEAGGAAWVAHRTIAQRLAHRHGGPPAPADAEPLSLVREGDRELILASGAPIATLVRPGVDSRGGSDSLGFEIQVPLAGDELAMRSIGYRIYRRLRASGVPWATWDSGRRTR
jgi:hypothetical protein